MSTETRKWLRGILAAAVSGIGTALAGVTVGLNHTQVLELVGVQTLIHIGLVLEKSPLPEEREEWTPEQRAAALAAKSKGASQ